MAHHLVHFAEKAHLDRTTLAWVNSAIVFGLIGAGLAVCAFGAIAFDIIHLFGTW